MAIYKKPVESSISIKKEISRLITVDSGDLLFTKANRNSINNEAANLFASFNLPVSEDKLTSGGTLASIHPELYQLNVDEAVFVEIQRQHYDEYINGRSITLTVPTTGGLRTIYSSLYSIDDSSIKMSSSSLLGENVSFLFADEINKPYSGTSDSELIDHSSNVTWSSSSMHFTERPNAVAYLELEQSDKNSDSRSVINTAVNVPATDYPTNLDSGYNYDIPVGFASLDKGYFVITHPDLVNNIDWTAGTKNHIDSSGAIISDGSWTSGEIKNITFSGTGANSTFYSIDMNYTTSVLCLAMPQEFFLSTNPTWNIDRNLTEIENETFDMDPIFITQIGLYNQIDELVAVAKLNKPVKKEYTNILTFSLNLEV